MKHKEREVTQDLRILKNEKKSRIWNDELDSEKSRMLRKL